MNTKIGVIILAVVCAGLAVGLFAVKNQADKAKREDTDVIIDFSNRWESTTGELGRQVQSNVVLTNQLAASQKELGALTNKLGEVSATLAQTENSLKASQDEVAKRDARIADLETQKEKLNQTSMDLSNRISNLTIQIDDTNKKLAASEGDKAFLEKELQRLINEKAVLERQFNDLAAMRAQVAKLKAELDISRRLDWIRKGLFATADQRGAQQLIQRGPAADTNTSHYDLNVELSPDGSVHVIPPLTNRPAATNPAPSQ